MDLKVQCPPSYVEKPKIVFCGESPGIEEVRERRGFVGPAGRCLQKACSLAGLDWNEVSLTNVCKRQPEGNKFKDVFYETIQEAQYTPTGKLSKKTRKVTRKSPELLEWENLLYNELEQQHPNLVVACGNEALQALTEVSGITNYRGSVLEGGRGAGFKVLAVEHPSYIIRGNTRDFWILAHDLKKARREMEFSEVRRDLFESYIQPDRDFIFSYLGHIQNCPDLLWTLDVETRAGTLACLAIARRAGSKLEQLSAMCIPIQTTSGPYWSPEDELEIWRALHETARANPNLCNQNIEYDIYYLLRYGVEPSGVWMDTMLAHSILYPEFPKGLDFLCSWYLDDVVFYKGEGRNWNAGDRDPQLWEYCCRDAAYTLRVVEKIDFELRNRGLYAAYHGHE